MTTSESVSIAAADGFSIAASEYLPNGSPRAVVVINAATAVRRRYYDRFAQYLASHGFAVVTYDYRGIGDSAPRRLRGFEASMQDWGELDQPAVVAHARHWQPGVPLMLIGHSVGGQIVGLLREPDQVSRVLLVAAQHNYYGLWRPQERYVLWALWTLVMPVASHALGYFPSTAFGLGENLPRGVALEWARWCRSPGALVEAIGGNARERFTRYRGPLLALSFSDDTKFAPRRAVDGLLEFYVNARREHVHLSPADLGAREIGHFGFFRERTGAGGWPIVLEWLGAGAV
jgi:predicted alpha/beta hydrolase